MACDGGGGGGGGGGGRGKAVTNGEVEEMDSVVSVAVVRVVGFNPMGRVGGLGREDDDGGGGGGNRIDIAVVPDIASVVEKVVLFSNSGRDADTATSRCTFIDGGALGSSGNSTAVCGMSS